MDLTSSYTVCLVLLPAFFMVTAILLLKLLWSLAFYFIERAMKKKQVQLTAGTCFFNLKLFTLDSVKLYIGRSTIVRVDQFWLSSRLLNSNCDRMVTFYLHGVEISLPARKVKSSSDTEGSSKRQPRRSAHEIISSLKRILYTDKLSRLIRLVGFVAENVSMQMDHRDTSLSLLPRIRRISLAPKFTRHHTFCTSLDVDQAGVRIQASPDSPSSQISVSTSVHVQIATGEEATLKSILVDITEVDVCLTDEVIRQMATLKGSCTNTTDTSRKSVSASQTADSLVQKCLKLLAFPLCPESVRLQVKRATVDLLRSTLYRTDTLAVDGIVVSMSQDTEQETIAASFVLQEVSIGRRGTSFQMLSSLWTDVQLSAGVITVTTALERCFLDIDKRELEYWLKVFSTHKLSAEVESLNSVTSNRLQRLLGDNQLSWSVATGNVSIACLANNCYVLEFGFGKGVLEFLVIDPLTVNGGLRLNSVFGLLLPQGECKPPADWLSLEQHDWRSVLYLEFLSLKLDLQSLNLYADLIASSLQVQYTLVFLQTLTDLASAVRLAASYPGGHSFKDRYSSGEALEGVGWNWSLSGKINDALCFMCTNSTCAIFRCTSLDLEHRTGRCEGSIASFCGMYCIASQSKSYHIRSLQPEECNVLFESITFSGTRATKTVDFRVNNDVHIKWNTALHMCMYNIFSEISAHACSLMNKGDAPSVPTEGKTELLTLAVSISAELACVFSLSRNHEVKMLLPDLKVNSSTERCSIKLSGMKVLCDGHAIVNAKKFDIVYCTCPGDRMARLRHNLRNVRPISNPLFSFSADALTFSFPHRYKFSQCYEELLVLNKWLRLLHGKAKKSSRVKSVPPDLKVSIHKFFILFEDDPFDVCLFRNYILRLDELVESEKRKELYSQYIEKLNDGTNPDFNKLAKADASIYINRSRLMERQCSSELNCVLTCEVKDLQLILLADERLIDYDPIIDMMRVIDPDSRLGKDIKFVTLFCRDVEGSVSTFSVKLRNYKSPLVSFVKTAMHGKLIIAEEAGADRASLDCTMEVDQPWDNMSFTRNMPPVKFYHDFHLKGDSFTLEYGPCWEPALVQFNIAFSFVNTQTVDPSPPLPYYDKLRLKYHGAIRAEFNKMNWVYHLSFNPYNVTELMEWSWANVSVDWTNAHFLFDGDLDIHVRTASRYDDYRILHLPQLTLEITVSWVCIGDPNSHHYVMPCAPTKVPEFSMEKHDSFKAFRSSNLNLNLNLKTAPSENESGPDVPRFVFFASTVRWLEKLKQAITKLPVNIRCGKIHNNLKPRLRGLVKHIQNFRLVAEIKELHGNYWTSFAKQLGAELYFSLVQLNSAHCARLERITDDRLLHRETFSISNSGSSAKMRDFYVRLCRGEGGSSVENLTVQAKEGRTPHRLHFLLSIPHINYKHTPTIREIEWKEPDQPIHDLQIFEVKAVWNKVNRDIVYKLLDIYDKASKLRKNLSSDVLRPPKFEAADFSRKRSYSRNASVTSPPRSLPCIDDTDFLSPNALSLLERLKADASTNFNVYEDPESINNPIDDLYGKAACSTQDIVQKNIHIAVKNVQILLQGIESPGFVIVSASDGDCASFEHDHVWRKTRPLSKTTYAVSINCMQCHATVAHTPRFELDSVWLSTGDVENRPDQDPPSLMGVLNRSVSHDVGAMVGDKIPSLQLIVSRGLCELFYVSYGELVDSDKPLTQPSLETNCLYQDEYTSCVTFVHHGLIISANSTQYLMIADIVENLLLYEEQEKKELTDRSLRDHFRLALSDSLDEQKDKILLLQEKIRYFLQDQRALEYDLYIVKRAKSSTLASDAVQHDQQCRCSKCECEDELKQLKKNLADCAEDLQVSVSAFKQYQLTQCQLNRVMSREISHEQRDEGLTVFRYEVFLKDVKWTLTMEDGQLGIAFIDFRNFSYNKLIQVDESFSHQFDIGWMAVESLLKTKQSPYTDVLTCEKMSGKQPVVRVYCKEKPNIGGIRVKEHFEVNITPIVLKITAKFYRTLMAYFFPDRNIDEGDSKPKRKADTNKMKKGRKSTFYYDSQEAAEIMKRRTLYSLFVYVKIPEIPLKLSYKGSKEKNLSDLNNLSLTFPTIQYQNEQWSWLDFLLSVKSEGRRALLHQAIKQKLLSKKSHHGSHELLPVSRCSEDKAKLLFGSARNLTDTDKSKKGLFSKLRKR